MNKLAMVPTRADSAPFNGHRGMLALEHADGEAAALGLLKDLVGYNLRRASSAFAGDLARTLEGTGMRQVLVGILSVIAANPGVNQGAAGQALGIQRANMVSLINELVDHGLINREVSAADRRAFELNILPAGEEILAECYRRIAEHEERMLACLSAGERDMLIDMLTRISAQGGMIL